MVNGVEGGGKVEKDEGGNFLLVDVSDGAEEVILYFEKGGFGEVKAAIGGLKWSE